MPEIAVIHVHDPSGETTFPYYESINAQQMQNFQRMMEDMKKEREKILEEAEKFLKGKNINARTILKEGHPADIIIKMAKQEGFDMIVVGSRGLGGLQKLFLGSVSNAIIQEAENCSVLVLK